MATVDEALQSQLRNIEATYGKPIKAWVKLIGSSGKTKHTEVVAMLKSEHGMTHGSAHRVALVAREALGPATAAAAGDPAGALYVGAKAVLRPIHDKVMKTLGTFGKDVEVAPKKGYLSLRRKKQFAMLQPGAKWLNLGLILKGEATTARLESAASFNALFTHRVKVEGPTAVDRELVAWLKQAYDQAG